MIWLRGYASNAAGDSVYVGLNGQVVSLTGLAPNAWGWARTTTNGVTATLPITTTGLQTISVWMREDGIRLDRLLLTTDTTYIPTGFGPTETPRLLANRLVVPLDRTIVYTYDNLYRLTEADYSTGELYEYDYDPVGNRLEQIINGDTTTYTYDDANRLDQVTHQSTVVSYQFDDNGNLLKTGVLTNVFDAANRLTSTVRAEISPILPQYNGVGDRVAQTVDETTVYYALDVIGLPEVIQTSEGNSYLHLPGVIMAESSTGEVRYLLSDGLGSIRQAVDETGEVVSSDEFDPYGNPLTFHASRFTPYAYTGEWWQEDVGLLHLRARWYLAETGAFVSRDAWPGEDLKPLTLNGWSYIEGNPINRADPSGLYWWGPGQALWDASERRAQSQNIHVRIQALMMLGRMDEVHAEYIIPGTNLPVDLLNSVSGEMWEIKPWDDQVQGLVALNERLVAMNVAREAELLQGMNPVAMPYNWNFSPPEWFEGATFPPGEIYIGTDDSGYFDIYAAQTRPGIIAWWKYRREHPKIVPYPIVLPERVAWGERNIRRGWNPSPISSLAYCSAVPTNEMAIDTHPGAIIGIGIGVGTTGALIWWFGKLLSPLCGPGAPVCAVVF